MKTIQFLTLIVLFVVAGQATADSLLEIRAVTDTNRITIGDRIHYTVAVSHGGSVRIRQVENLVDFSPFEVKDFKKNMPEANKDSSVTERFEYTLTIYDTGHYSIPPFPIIFYADSSDSGQTLYSQAVPVTVVSVLAGADSVAFEDIRPPIDIPMDWAFWAWMALASALTLLAAWFIYRAWKQKQETGYIFRPPPPPPPAHEVALQALAELYRSDLLDKGEYKAFYSRLSDILRTYLEGRYFIPAPESVTDEILRDLRAHLHEKEIARIEKILRVADMVKFAKHIPDRVTTQNIMRDTEQFVLDTKLVFEPAEQTPEEKNAIETREDTH
ncbi:MAG: hypothetical protein D6677_09955 [Calditrichaeota bacterium]|nr:MAG: hypothetical protein D6677_09955 [Calditrichota bacterium]